MTYPKYTQQALSRYNLPHLKRIATELGVTPTGDKRAAQTWVNAIITHQSTKLQKVDNQALAQAELDSYIADQAQAITPEPLTIVEISFDHHEYYAGNQLIATIAHDDNHLTQRWVVMVNDKEVFRANTPMRCDRFICTHYKDGSLPVQEEAEGQGAECRGERFSPTLPAPCSLSSSTTDNGVQPGYLQFGTRCKQMLQKPILQFTNLPKNGIETFKFLHTEINSSGDSVSQTCP